MRAEAVQPVVLLILANKSLHTNTISHSAGKKTNLHSFVTVKWAKTSSASWIFKCMASQGQETHYKFIKLSKILRGMIKSYDSVIITTNVLQFGSVVPSRSKGEESHLIGNYIMTWGIAWVTLLSNFKKWWLPGSHAEVISWDLAPFVRNIGLAGLSNEDRVKWGWNSKIRAVCTET